MSAIAGTSAAAGSWPTVTAATAIPNSGTVTSSGLVRAAPIRFWLRLRQVQPATKCRTPAAANQASDEPGAPASASSPPLTALATISASAATAICTNVEANGSIPRTARMFSVWNRPNPMPDAAATTAPLTAWTEPGSAART